MHGIAHYASLFGPWTFHYESFFYQSDSSQRNEKEKMNHLEKWGADGIIAREFTRQTQENILSLNIPTVISTVYNQEVKDAWGNLYVDNYSIGKMAAMHLLEKGFKYFAYCGINDFFWSLQRSRGYIDTIANNGFEVLVYTPPKSRRKKIPWEEEQVFLCNWLRSLPRPIGLMACIDEKAQDIIQACKLVNIRIPEEVSIVSGDNDDLLCQLSNPQLSSVAINGQDAGYAAAALLDRLMKGQNPKDKTIFVRPTHVVTRNSTDIFAVSDENVAEALGFIRSHFHEPIQVSDVAYALAVTRQGLNKKFKHHLNRSVHDEIIRMRIQQVSRLLIETNMTISEIATSVGYPELKFLTRSFRKNKGMPPSEYRKRFRAGSAD